MQRGKFLAVGLILCLALAGCSNKYVYENRPLDAQHLQRFIAEQNIQPLDTLDTPTYTAILQRDPNGVGCYVAWQRGQGEIAFGYEATDIRGGLPVDSGPVLAIMKPKDARILLCLVINDPELRRRTSRVEVQFFRSGMVTVPLNNREGVIIVAPESPRASMAYDWIVLYDADGREVFHKVPPTRPQATP